MRPFRKYRVHGAAVMTLLLAGGVANVESALAQTPASRSFDVPAGSLGSAVASLGRQANVMITVDPELVRGRRTAGLRGDYTPERALNALLTDSGLTAQPDGRGGFILAAAAVTSSDAASSSRPQVPTESATRSAGEDLSARSIDVIVVTGQKIRRTLLDTQVSVGVVTAEDIEAKDLTTFREAFRTMANVMSGDWLDAGYVIRGVNSEGLTSGSPLASLYIDGAEQTKMGTRRGSRGLWDVEQVEVYRGPQSTLSGRAALAGALYINTRDPSYDYDAAVRASAGELGTIEGALAVGGPIIDDVLAFRVAAEYQQRDTETSYPSFTQYKRYDTLSEDKYYQFRGKLRIDPLPGLTATLSHAYSYDSPAYDDVGGPGLGWAYEDRRGDFNQPVFQEARETDNHSSSARLVYELSPSITLTALATLADTDTDRGSVNEGTPGEIYVVKGTEEERLFTQELRVNYDGANAVRAVGGLYYNHYRADSVRTSTLPNSGGRTDDTSLVNRADNYAVFGEVTVPLLDNLSLVAGGRFDRTEADISSFFQRQFVDPALPGTLAIYDVGNDESEFLPKLGFDVELSPVTKVGVVAQRGFRPGGVQRDTNNGVVTSFDSESTMTYETSLRHSVGRRGNLALNLFYTDWKDQQVRFDSRDAAGNLSRITVNAGESRIYGGEFEARLGLRRDLSAFTSLGYLDTKFERFMTADLGDFTGLSFPQAPDWTAAAGFDYRPDTGFFCGADAKYVGSFISRDMQDAPIDAAGDYTIVNVRIGYAWDGMSVTIFADNLFDEQYFLYRNRIDFGTGPQDLFGTMGRSRITGITAQARF
jgi:outer membrane receptor protein involved in Fe transport